MTKEETRKIRDEYERAVRESDIERAASARERLYDAYCEDYDDVMDTIRVTETELKKDHSEEILIELERHRENLAKNAEEYTKALNHLFNVSMKLAEIKLGFER